MIRLIKGSNLEKYINDIQNHDWSLVSHHDSCQSAFTYFVETLKGIFHNALLPPLTYITNLSFTEGVFPFELKIAQVLPLY